MLNIKNYEDARLAYILLREVERAGQCGETAAKKFKAAIREFYKRIPDGDELIQDAHFVCGDYDSYTYCVYMPDEVKSVSDARTWFMNHMYRELPNSQYDCTGWAFTSNYHIFKRGNRYGVYHTMAMDV